MEKNNLIRDILYFDFEKASSIWSQFQWGKQKEITVTSEEGKGVDGKISLGIPEIASAGLNIGSNDKRIILETRILHHDLLNRIESFLESEKLIIDLNTALSREESSPEKIHDTFDPFPFVRASGWSTFEDFQRLLKFSEKQNEIAAFIGRSSAESNPKYQEILNLIQEEKNKLEQNAQTSKNTQIKKQIKHYEGDLENIIQKSTSHVEDWIIEGIKLWVSTFMPTRLNFRVYPFEKCQSFQILCNLKRDAFVDQDLEHLLYGYGTYPNVKLGIFGLITSNPQKNYKPFDALAEFDEKMEFTNEMAIEKAFRNVFLATEGMEKFSRFSRYPNIIVHPIAVYRSFDNN